MPAGTLALHGGRVIPAPGTIIEGGTVLIVDGLVRSVGTQPPPPGVPVIDTTGRWVLPGLVEAHAHVGINEEGNGMPGIDTNESSSPMTAGARAIDAVNTDDIGFTDALAGGVTTVLIKPGSGNAVGGLSVAIKTWGGLTIDERWLGRDVSVKSAVGENPKTDNAPGGPVTRMGVARVIRQAFEDARHFVAQRTAAGDQPFRRDLDLDMLARVLSGELAWDVHAHRQDDIATALRLADEFGLRLVLNHGTEGGPLAGLLADRGIPVIFGPIITSRTKVELAGYSAHTIVELAKAGVRVAITTDHPEVPIGLLALQAGLAVREGLDSDLALAAITTEPARMYGLDDRVGSLSPGLDGDVAVWSGNPLLNTSKPELVVVGGEIAYKLDPEAKGAV